eukprot:65430-Prymnesium_polylepis.1
MGEADVLECMSCGNANRVVGTTLMNAQSSRSHALLTITVQQKMPDGSTKVSKLNVADLAGSEKVRADREQTPPAKRGLACGRHERLARRASHTARCAVRAGRQDGLDWRSARRGQEDQRFALDALPRHLRAVGRQAARALPQLEAHAHPAGVLLPSPPVRALEWSGAPSGGTPRPCAN